MSFRLRALAPTLLALSLGLGCGGNSCGGLTLRPLPKDPAPHGFPTNQLIEGGIQARITKPGMDKLMAAIPDLISGMKGFCAIQPKNFIDAAPIQTLGVCTKNECGGGTQKGCAAYTYFDSADRPAASNLGPPFPAPAAGQQDNKNFIKVTLNDIAIGGEATLTVDAAFDLYVPILGIASGLISDSCYLRAYSSHLTDNAAEPVHMILNIVLGIEPTTGELTLHLSPLLPIQFKNLGLKADGCGVLGDLLGDVLGVLDVFEGTLGTILLNILQPQLDALFQGLLPKPLGLAGTMDGVAMFPQYHPPKDASMELFLVPGGYVAANGGGLTLGVMTGANSDRDQTTRTPGLTSEPNLCVPQRAAPDLAAMPWNLPFNSTRKDFTLNPAGEFAGNPEPMTGGNLQDVAIGVSRTFMDLLGFHLFNSGTLCLSIGGDNLPQLNSGTLSVIVGSLGNILEDKKAPLALALRPQNPITWKFGAGSPMDPLVRMIFKDLRLDFYGWMEERWVRLFTMALDLNIGLNLTFTKTADGRPALQPMLVGVDAANIGIRISNTDLVKEKPQDLEKIFPSLLNLATSALGSALKPVTLPQVGGFRLDDLTVHRVTTSEDSFLGIFGGLAAGATIQLTDWSDPFHPKAAGEVETRAEVSALEVPPAEVLGQLARMTPEEMAASRPRARLHLSAEGADGRPVEFAWRVDGGMWRPWTQETDPVLADDAFLLQGRHTVDVRARTVGDWKTEDGSPAHLEVLVDSMPPEAHPARDLADPTRLAFHGWDLVSDEDRLRYAWIDARGQRTAWTTEDSLPLAEVARVTDEGARPFQLSVLDEAGNVASLSLELGPELGFHGRTTAPQASGCGCVVGGAAPGGEARGMGLLAAAGAALLLLARRRRPSARAALASLLGSREGRRGLAALAPTILAAGLSLLAGCGCDKDGLACSINDDCAKMRCAAGQLATCEMNTCQCSPDVTMGDVGRYASMTLIEGEAYVAAYNATYGDLMIGHVTPPGVVSSWTFVDGVPDEAPAIVGSQVRGGVQTKGDDVGRYASIAVSAKREPIVAYYDRTHGALRFASFGAIRWHTYAIDGSATATPEGVGDDVGRWASLSVGPDGRPAIAYTASTRNGTRSGMPEGQLRVAQARVADPVRPEDWDITVVDARPLSLPSGFTDGGVPTPSPPDAGTVTDTLLPEGIGLMPAMARRADGRLGIAYYDRTRGNLRFVEEVREGQWGTPVILDGEAPTGADTADVGLYPSLAYDDAGVAHISYVDSSSDNLLYVNTKTNTPEVVDDGYRPKDEVTTDGLDSPVFHLVGDSSSIGTASGVVGIAYQDSTVAQLRVALRGQDGKWRLSTVAGHAQPYQGSYGFYANLRISGRQGYVSSYAVNQQADPAAYFVEVFAVDLGLLM